MQIDTTAIQIGLVVFILVLLPYIYYREKTGAKKMSAYVTDAVHPNEGMQVSNFNRPAPVPMHPFVQPTQIQQEVQPKKAQYGWLDWWQGIRNEWMDKMPHLLIVARTRSGKSVLVRALVKERAKLGHKIVMVDEHAAFEDWLDLTPKVLSELADVHKAFLQIQAEYNLRREQLKRGEIKKSHFQPITIMLEEYNSLVDTAGLVSKYNEKEIRQKQFIAYMVKTLSQGGAKFNLNLIVAAQQDGVKSLGIEGNVDAKRNFATIYLGGKSKDALKKICNRHYRESKDPKHQLLATALDNSPRPGVILYDEKPLPVTIPGEMLRMADQVISFDFTPNLPEPDLGTSTEEENEDYFEGEILPINLGTSTRRTQSTQSTQPKIDPSASVEDLQEATIEYLKTLGVTPTRIAEVVKGRRADVLHKAKVS